MLDYNKTPLIKNIKKIAMKGISNFKESLIFRIAPPTIISTILSLITMFGGDSYTQYAGITMLTQLQNLGTIAVLIGAYLAFVLICFKKEFDGYWHWKRKKRLIHKISFIALAIIAAMIPYLCATSTFFFNAIDHDYNVLNIEQKIVILVYFGFYSFLATDMFSGLLGKGLLFKIPTINRSPMKKYIPLETKIRKYLPSKINKILAVYD
ncbi:MAG: hypothetical protein EB149_05385 [Thaumarchaeota archaeon]|nr:hypothetical protein [Nitrososphaerota archaeon]